MNTQAFERMFASMKFWTAVAAVIINFAAIVGLSHDKAVLVAGSVTTLAAAIIGGTAYEDGQAASNSTTTVANGGTPPTPDVLNAIATGMASATAADAAETAAPGGLASSPIASVTKLLIVGASLGILLCGVGCQSMASPDYVTADRATYDAVAQEYLTYVHSDPAMSDTEINRRERTVQTWDARIASQEHATTQPAQ